MVWPWPFALWLIYNALTPKFSADYILYLPGGLIVLGIACLFSFPEGIKGRLQQYKREKYYRECELREQALTAEWATAPPLPTHTQVFDAIYDNLSTLAKLSSGKLPSLFAAASTDMPWNPKQDRPAEVLALYQRYARAAATAIKHYQDLQPPAPTGHGFNYDYVLSDDERRCAANVIATTFTDNFVVPWPNAQPPEPDELDEDDFRNNNGELSRSRYEAAKKRRENEIEKRWAAISPLEAALVHTPLYRYAEEAIPTTQRRHLALSEAHRYTGTWIISPPGQGKTNLLHNLVEKDLATDEKTIILMDSKGDLINPYRTYPGAVVITKDNISINPFKFGTSTRALEFLEYIFSALLDTTMTPLQKTLFREVLTLILHLPNATLETFRQILVHGLNDEQKAVVHRLPPATKDFFATGKPPEFYSSTYADTKQQVLWRLRLLLSNEYLRKIFGSTHTSHNFFDLLDSRRLIIIDNSKDDLGGEGAEFFGRFFVAIVWMAAISRSKLREDQKVPVYFYIDECQTVIGRDEKYREIIQECRSQKIAMTVAHQYMVDIKSDTVKSALYNSGVRIANSDDDASQVAPRLNTTPEAIKLPPHRFACFVRGQTPQAVTIQVPFANLSAIPHGEPYVPPAPPTMPVEEPIAPPAPQTQQKKKKRQKDDF